MHLLNLSLTQFLVIFGSASAVAVALYLFDRSRRRQVVSTLRFWEAAGQPAATSRRRRIQQPWSLVLQLLSMALILLALAQLRFGGNEPTPRDHVIVLDTSAWMGASANGRTLMETARERASQYLRSVPSGDRVMLVRADGLASPATKFEPDRGPVESAILASEPGSTALNLGQALDFARRIQRQEGRRPGEIAFVGAGRTAEREHGETQPARNLRVISVPDPVENWGLRKIGARRSSSDPEIWEIYVSVRNYGKQPRDFAIALEFTAAGQGALKSAVGSRRITLGPGRDFEASFEYRRREAGVLEVSLSPRDAFSADDRAALELPACPTLAVTVYSREPGLLRPALSANPQVSAVYRNPDEYRGDEAGLVILDRFAPPRLPAADSIWIDPPQAASPVPVRTRARRATFSRWNADQAVAAGLRTNHLKLDAASIFEPAQGDEVVAEADAGPVVVARPGRPKTLVLGFHPGLSGMRYELATPLLFANLLRWAAPEVFRRSELTGGSVGAVRVAMERGVTPEDARVVRDDGRPLLFTMRGSTLHFFAGEPGTVRVLARDRESVFSLSLPQLWDATWTPPAGVLRGVPGPASATDSPADLWPWLALAGAAGLLAEWLLFGRSRRRRAAEAVAQRRPAAATEVAAR